MSWDPLRDLRAWQERLEHLASPRGESWTPPVDIFETSDRYVLCAELPGLGRDDIDLAFEETRLTLGGRRGDATPAPDAAGGPVTFHQVERGHGSFTRTFDFAAPIDVGAVTADFADGILTVTIPKAPPQPSRRIEVR